jgi:hypothetical protein
MEEEGLDVKFSSGGTVNLAGAKRPCIHQEEHRGMTETPNSTTASDHFACDMTALSPEQRTTHQERIGQLFGRLLQERRELDDGYAYCFDGEHYGLLAAFIADERLCCPFFGFRLDVASKSGPLWLHLTAQGDVKPFLREELGSADPA